MFLTKAVFGAVTLAGCSLSLASVLTGTCSQSSFIATQRPIFVSQYHANKSPAFVTPTTDMDGWLAETLEAREMFDGFTQDEPDRLPDGFTLRTMWKEPYTNAFTGQQANPLENNGSFSTLTIRSALDVEPIGTASIQADNAGSDSAKTRFSHNVDAATRYACMPGVRKFRVVASFPRLGGPICGPAQRIRRCIVSAVGLRHGTLCLREPSKPTTGKAGRPEFF